MHEEQPIEEEGGEPPNDEAEEAIEKPLSLHEQRQGAVLAALRASGARRVLDLGCGEGRLLPELLKDKQFEAIVGIGRVDPIAGNPLGTGSRLMTGCRSLEPGCASSSCMAR